MLEISSLWVRDDLRCLGLGGRLFRDAEAEASGADGMGCCRGFQLPGGRFFLRSGYRAYAVLPGYAMNQARHSMRKRL